MERGVETTSLGLNGGGGERGAGGKARKPPARRTPSTPYSRPETSQSERRWLSRLVDPAYRLIAGGATLLLPSFFAKSPSSDDERLENELKEDDNGGDDSCTLNHNMSSPAAVSGSVQELEANRLGNSSSIDGLIRDKDKSLLNEIGLPEIEQLMKEKIFSRDEFNRLLEIIQSRAIEQDKKPPVVISGGEADDHVVSHEIPKIPSVEKREDSNKAIWGTSTPLHQSSMLDGVAASPVDIARAYMGTRTSEIGLPSKHMTPRDERTLLTADPFGSTPFIPSATPKQSTCWPGSMAQDQRGYFTPQIQRGRVGLHNFPRTPYSRTIYSKLKTKTQVKLNNDAAGSVGPIRQIGNRSIAETPSRGSAYFHPSLAGQSQLENLTTPKTTLLSMTKKCEPIGASNSSQVHSQDNHASEASPSTVHPPSTQIARTILEHISRNPPTPKEKSEEIKRAISWKQPSSSNAPNSSLFGGFNTQNNINQAEPKESAPLNADKGNNNFMFSLPPKESNDKSSNGINNNAVVFNTIPSKQNKPPHTSGSSNKPILPAIQIEKPISRWGFSSDNNSSSGFTFPVSASFGVRSEPPTPTIMPSVLATVQPSFPGPVQPSVTEAVAAVPSFSFGSKKSSRAVVFSFPSTSSAKVQGDDSEITFSFGSNDKARVSFSTVKKDAICY